MKATIERYEKQQIQVKTDENKVEVQEVAIITLMCEVPDTLPVGQLVEIKVAELEPKK